MQTPISRAIEIVGSQADLARLLETTPSFVNQWATGKRPMPARFAIPIERATNGAVTRYDLCPDVFGAPPQAAAQADPDADRIEPMEEIP